MSGRRLLITTGFLISCGLSVGVLSPALSQETGKHPILPGKENPQRRDIQGLAQPLSGRDLWEKARQSYQRGFDFLLTCQNKDGSWGSIRPHMAFLKDFGFRQSSRGSNDGVRIACTAIVAKALLRRDDLLEEERKALQRALPELLSLKKFAYDMGEAFNTWGYGYKLDFLCDYFETDAGRSDKERVAAAVGICVRGLTRYQQADGGWNYYATPVSGGASMSFNTANFAEALFRARKLGFDVPAALYEDAKKLLNRMQTKRGGFVYDARFLYDPGSVNELSSGSRTAAVAEALAEMGVYDDEDLLRCLDVFNEGENWLEDGRKLIQPHTAVHQISGYFFFYGYHYLAEFLTRLGEQVPRSRWERVAWTMVRTQEPDGCWWDTAAADYGDKWATGFALLVLQRYFENCPPPPAIDTPRPEPEPAIKESASDHEQSIHSESPSDDDDSHALLGVRRESNLLVDEQNGLC